MSYKLAPSVPVTTESFTFFFKTFIIQIRVKNHMKEFFVLFSRLKCRRKVKIVKILHGYFVQNSVFITPKPCDHTLFMEPLVFWEVLLASEVYQTISHIDLPYVIKTGTSVLFGPTAGKVISFPGDKEARA